VAMMLLRSAHTHTHTHKCAFARIVVHAPSDHLRELIQSLNHLLHAWITRCRPCAPHGGAVASGACLATPQVFWRQHSGASSHSPREENVSLKGNLPWECASSCHKSFAAHATRCCFTGLQWWPFGSRDGAPSPAGAFVCHRVSSSFTRSAAIARISGELKLEIVVCSNELPQSFALHHHATRVAARRCPRARPGCGCRENRRRRVAGSRQHRHILVSALVSCSCRGTCTCWICAAVSHPAQVSERPLTHPTQHSLDSSWPAECVVVAGSPDQARTTQPWPTTHDLC
jgi:hypothetical protein